VIQFRTSVHFSSLDRNDFLTTTLIAFGIEHIQCAAIFETKDFPGLIIYVSLDCLNLLSNYSDQQSPLGICFLMGFPLDDSSCHPNHTFHFPHFIPSYPYFWDFWVYSPKKGLSLISCEEGVEGPKDPKDNECLS
jgi:hypothetical protein